MIRLAKPNITEEAINAVNEVLRSGNLVQGKYVAEFEENLKNYLGVNEAVVVTSGTAALHLSLIALDIQKGDEVIVPAFTFPATANVVELVGAKPVFVDINLDDFCIDVNKIEEAITSKTTAIIPVHEFGQSAQMDKILEICNKYNLKLIEDAACALGTEYKNKKVGTFGDFGCFSFHPRKAITTGEGGVIITNNKELAGKVRALRNHGIELINGKVEFKYAGFNYRMTDFQAVLGIYQLKDFEKEITERINQAELYNKLLSEINWIKTPVTFSERKMTYQTYHILVDDNIDRDNLLDYLINNGVQVNYGAQALNVQYYYNNKYKLIEQFYINAEISYNYGVALPIGSFINKENINTIVNLLKYYE
jgi:dTDP-4-amino-4,6-dideoxygalactose transaminase